MRKSPLVCAAFVAAMCSRVYAAGPLTAINIGNWHGGSYTDDANKYFSHCVVNSYYNSGITFFVSVSSDYSWRLAFSHPNWKLNIGQTIPIDLTFDGRGLFHVFGQVTMPNFVKVEMPNTSEVIRRFRNAQQMTAFANGQIYQFILTQTSIMIPALVQCVRDNTRSAAPQVAIAPAPAVIAPPVQSSDSAVKSDLHDEALELATNFLLSAKLDSPKIISKSETPVEYASFGADWKAAGAVGSVRIIAEQPDTKALDVTAAVIGADAKECKGKFASARSSDMVDSEVVFRGFSSCEDSAGNRSVEYFVLPRKKGGFALFSISVAPSAGDASTAVQRDRITIFQKAALTAVN